MEIQVARGDMHGRPWVGGLEQEYGRDQSIVRHVQVQPTGQPIVMWLRVLEGRVYVALNPGSCSDIAVVPEGLEPPVRLLGGFAKFWGSSRPLQVVDLAEDHREDVSHVPTAKGWSVGGQVGVVDERIRVYNQSEWPLVMRQEVSELLEVGYGLSRGDLRLLDRTWNGVVAAPALGPAPKQSKDSLSTPRTSGVG